MSKGTDVSAPVEKEKWASKTEFMLSCLGFAVGLGNIWRFPYLCGRNGGAAFLMIFLLIIVIGGVPMAFMELGLGQYSSLASHQLFAALCPLFSGLGYVMILTSLLTALYYNMVIAWAIYYLAASFTSDLPWKTCDNWWNSDHCLDKDTERLCIKSNLTYWKGTCWNESDVIINGWQNVINTSLRSNPSKEYFDRKVLNLSGSIDELGTVSWELALCLLLAWLMVFGILIKGVKSAGKVIYFTATVPYVLLLALLIRGSTLPHAIDGVKFFIIPDFARLTESSVWGDAAVQVFFSMSVGAGGLTTLSSYNVLDNNILRDTIVITLGNIFTSLLSGFVVFSILGFMASELGTTVAAIADSGPGLLFVTYPYALTRLPLSPLWSCLFFFTVILMGIDSQIVLVEVVITACKDQWPALRDPRKKIALVAGICIVSFLAGLLTCAQAGAYIINLLDTYAGGWPLLMQCLLELVIVSYIYGVKQYMDDYKFMLGEAPSKLWKFLGYPVCKFYHICWVGVTPISLSVLISMLLNFCSANRIVANERSATSIEICKLSTSSLSRHTNLQTSIALENAVLIFNFFEYSATTYDDYVYPLWSEVLGWLLAFSACLPALVWALWKIMVIVCTNSKEDIKIELKKQITPTRLWHQNRFRAIESNSKIEEKPPSSHV